MTYTTAHGNAGSLTHWARPRIKPTSSWILVRFVNHWAMMGTPYPFACQYAIVPPPFAKKDYSFPTEFSCHSWKSSGHKCKGLFVGIQSYPIELSILMLKRFIFNLMWKTLSLSIIKLEAIKFEAQKFQITLNSRSSDNSCLRRRQWTSAAESRFLDSA